jgi:hypothetical protein
MQAKGPLHVWKEVFAVAVVTMDIMIHDECSSNRWLGGLNQQHFLVVPWGLGQQHATWTITQINQEAKQVRDGYMRHVTSGTMHTSHTVVFTSAALRMNERTLPNA